MTQERLRNPFQSEQDAFRLLMVVGAAVAAIVVAAAIGGAWLGVPVAVIVLAVATRATFRWLRSWLAPPDEDQNESEQGRTGPGSEQGPPA